MIFRGDVSESLANYLESMLNSYDVSKELELHIRLNSHLFSSGVVLAIIENIEATNTPTDPKKQFERFVEPFKKL